MKNSIRCFAFLAVTAFWCRSVRADSGLSTSAAGELPDAPSVSASASSAATNRSTSKAPLEAQDHPPVRLVDVPWNMLRDGAHIVAAPAYVRWRDLKWLIPIGGATAAALNTDTWTMTQVVSRDPAFNQTSANVSNGLVYSFIAAPVALYGAGLADGGERMHETGLLAGEAIADAYIVDTVVKLCAFRERPNVDNGHGNFYVGSAGIDSSFISGHSMIAWSSAAVLAGESRSKWVQAGLYTAAAGVSVTRVLGQQHFPSDVLVGATTGWLIGHYVLRAHHHVPLGSKAK